MTPTARAQRRLLTILERTHGPRVRRAFESAIRDARNGISISDLIRMIERQDIAGALAVVGIGTAVFRGFEVVLTDAFEKAGRAFTSIMPKNVRDPRRNRVTFRYDMRLPRAEALLRRHVIELTGDVTRRQIETIRSYLVAGLGRGANPRTVALDIAGRVDRTTGRRVGGLIGLTGPQAEYLQSVRGITSDPERIREYFIQDRETGRMRPRYTLTPRGFDDRVRQAIAEGRALSAPDRERLLTGYSSNMLRSRAQNIARSTTLDVIRAGKHEAFDQAMDVAGLPADAMERGWSTSGDERVREDHEAADGQRVGKDEAFIVGGERLMYPGDPSASLKQTSQCRCVEIHVISWDRAAN